MGINAKLAKKQILVVDDQSYLRQLIRTTLSASGFENLLEAKNGAIALKKLEQNKVDLVISDWEMPELDGLKLFEGMQSNPRLKDTPFILLTKHSSTEKVKEAIKLGITNYVVKPFTPDAIMSKVFNVVQQVEKV